MPDRSAPSKTAPPTTGTHDRRPGQATVDEPPWAASTARSGEPRAHPPPPLLPLPRLARASFVGRDDELARLTAWLAPGPAGPDVPTLIALHGPAGIGKTSLLRAALDAAGQGTAAAAVLWGAADEGRHATWMPLAGMVRALAAAPAGHPSAADRVCDLVDEMAARLPSAEAGELRAVLPLLLALLGAGPEPLVVPDAPPRVRTVRTRTVRTSLRRALLLLAQAFRPDAPAGLPVVFVVTGADVLDVPMRDALAFAASRVGRRARVVLLSSAPLRLAPAFEGGFAVHRLALGALSARAAKAVVASMLQEGSPDVEAAYDALAAPAYGSPLALVHGVRLAAEVGQLSHRDGRWHAPSATGLGDVPGRIDRLLRARIERLSPSTRALLAGCAALGPAFLPADAALVGASLGLARDEVHAALRPLIAAGLLALPAAAADDDDDHRSLAFEHPLLREAALAAVGSEERRRLCAIAAEALEARQHGTEPLAAWLAALHVAAGHHGRALEHLQVAVRRARLLDDRQAALALAKEGAALAGDDGAAALPFLFELEALRTPGPGPDQRDAHRAALRELLRAASLSDDPATRAAALLRVARFDLAGDLQLAAAACERALAELGQHAPPQPSHARLAAHGYRELASVRARNGDVEGAAVALADARACVAGERDLLAAIDQQEGSMWLERGDPVRAVELLVGARAHRAATGDVGGTVLCLGALADAYGRRGRAETALALLDEALRLANAIGDGPARAQATRRMADALLALGDVAAGRTAAQHARALAQELGNERLEEAAALACARAHFACGELLAAEAVLEPLRQRAGAPHVVMQAALLAARLWLVRAEVAAGPARERALRSALARARDVVALGEQHAALAVQAHGLALAGEALLLDGDAGAALAWTQRAVEMLDDLVGETFVIEDVLAPFVRVLEAMGDDEEALAVRARARAVLEPRAARLPPLARELFWSVAPRAFLCGPPMNADDARGN